MSGALEVQREALVQKIGENISVRRATIVEGKNVDGYVHSNGKIAVLVNLTAGDSVLAKDVAMHVAAVNPQVAKPEYMDAALLEKERAIYVAQAEDSGKPVEIIEKMVEGRVRKFLAESSLVEQLFVKDPDLKVGQLLKNSSADITSFYRYEVGEGIEKEEVDFAAEVAAQVKQLIKKALSAFFYTSKKRFHAGSRFFANFLFGREVRAVNTLNDRKYKRVLIKLSGEALQGEGDFGIDPRVLDRMALEIGQLVGIGVQVGLVIGGGNLFRGAELSEAGLDRVTGDHMGMLATTMNALAMRDALERSNIPTTAMSAIPMSGVVAIGVRRYVVWNRVMWLFFQQERVTPFSHYGFGCRFACAIETDAELMIKATKVDGVYDADPMENATAVKFDTLTYDEVLDRKLAVMDLTAICLCRDHNMPVRVFEIEKTGALVNIVVGLNEGTLIQ